jgi:hypothetical protein
MRRDDDRLRWVLGFAQLDLGQLGAGQWRDLERDVRQFASAGRTIRAGAERPTLRDGSLPGPARSDAKAPLGDRLIAALQTDLRLGLAALGDGRRWELPPLPAARMPRRLLAPARSGAILHAQLFQEGAAIPRRAARRAGHGVRSRRHALAGPTSPSHPGTSGAAAPAWRPCWSARARGWPAVRPRVRRTSASTRRSSSIASTAGPSPTPTGSRPRLLPQPRERRPHLGRLAARARQCALPARRHGGHGAPGSPAQRPAVLVLREPADPRPAPRRLGPLPLRHGGRPAVTDQSRGASSQRSPAAPRPSGPAGKRRRPGPSTG